MKSVPIKELKENLSQWAEAVSKGSEILVTKHNRPYIRLTPGNERHLYRGSMVGQGGLKAVGRRLTGGKWLKFLEEDRKED